MASDGYNLYDKVGNSIEGGDTLVPLNLYVYQNGWCSESQGSIFLPIDSSKYYFITPTFSDARFNDCFNNGNCYADLLLYNVIDMNSNGGAGKVVKRMVPLLENANLRKTQMMACRHANGKDWWLLKQEGDSANVHSFLFTQDSVYDKGVQVFAEPVWSEWDIRGQSTFKLDGTQYASTTHGNNIGLVFVADFDRCYGKLTNPKVLEIPTGSQHNPNDNSLTEKLGVGLAYSPNGQFLYLISMRNVYQYDLLDNTWFHVAGLDTTYNQFQDYETAYLGPDGKIYIGNWGGGSKQMSRIDNPDVKGAGCNFCPRCLRLDTLSTAQGNFSVGTPPCMPNYSLGVKVCSPEAVAPSPQGEGWGEVVVYPNPSLSIFYIKNKKGKQKQLLNLLGEVLLVTSKDEIDASSFAKGIYFIRCEGQTKKVIIE